MAPLSPLPDSRLTDTSSTLSLVYDSSNFHAALTFQQFVNFLAVSNFNAAHNLRRIVAIHTFPEEYSTFIQQISGTPMPTFIYSLSSSFRRLFDLELGDDTMGHSSEVTDLLGFFDWLRPYYRIEVKPHLACNSSFTLRIHRSAPAQLVQSSTTYIEGCGPSCVVESDDDELQHWLLAGLPGLPFSQSSSCLDGKDVTGDTLGKPDHICVRGGFTRKVSQKSTVNDSESSSDDDYTYLEQAPSIKSFPERQPLNNNGTQFLLQIASALRRTDTGDLKQHLTDVLNTAMGRFQNGASSLLDVDNLDSIAERCHQLDRTIMSLDFIYMINCILLWNKVARSAFYPGVSMQILMIYFIKHTQNKREIHRYDPKLHQKYGCSAYSSSLLS